MKIKKVMPQLICRRWRSLRLLTILIISLYVLVPCRVAATVLWVSYSDQARTIVSDNFVNYGVIVYMKATGLGGASKIYTARYYDGVDIHIASDVGMSSGGVFLSEMRPANFPDAIAGTWRAELYNNRDSLVAIDTFQVSQGAIPEFPTTLASLVVPILASVGWFYIRRKQKKEVSGDE